MFFIAIGKSHKCRIQFLHIYTAKEQKTAEKPSRKCFGFRRQKLNRSQKVPNLFSFGALNDSVCLPVKVIACSGDCFHLTLLHSLHFPPNKKYFLETLFRSPLCGPRGSNVVRVASVISSDSPAKCLFFLVPCSFILVFQKALSTAPRKEKAFSYRVVGCLLLSSLCLHDKFPSQSMQLEAFTVAPSPSGIVWNVFHLGKDFCYAILFQLEARHTAFSLCKGL